MEEREVGGGAESGRGGGSSKKKKFKRCVFPLEVETLTSLNWNIR